MNRRNTRKAQLRKAHAQHALRVGSYVPAVALVGFGETIRLDAHPNQSSGSAQQIKMGHRWHQV